MGYTLYSSDYDLPIDGRLLIYNIKERKVHDRLSIINSEKLTINDQEVLSNVLNFKFRFQKKVNDKWINTSGYFYLENAIHLRKFWRGEKNFNDKEVEEIIKFFINDSENINFDLIVNAVNSTISFIKKSESQNLDNLKQYFRVSEYLNIEHPVLWKNINLYLKTMITLVQKFRDFNLLSKPYNLIIQEIRKNKVIEDFFNREIIMLKKYDLQFAYILSGLYYNFLGERESAVINFKHALEYNNMYHIDFKLGTGITTYKNEIKNRGKFNNRINFMSDLNKNTSGFTLIISVDSKFLRKYSMQIFYSILALKKYHFHFHVIGDYRESVKSIVEAEYLFNNMKDFYDSPEQIIAPTFSTEECPDYVREEVTYFACARFVNVEYFMDKFKTDILTFDADFFIINDFRKYINELKEFDVSMAFSKGILTFNPWTRYMAGNVYVKNNDKGRSFIKIMTNYIEDNLDNEQSWTLDQNALTYAIERIKQKDTSIKIGNSAKYARPMNQPAIRRFIEN